MDVSDFSRNGAPPERKAAERRDFAWWKDSASAAKSISAVVTQLRGAQSARRLQLSIAARLYGNSSVLGLPGARGVQPATKERLSYNVVQSGIDTATAKIAKNKPKPLFLTNGGDREQQRKAKNLNKFVEGIFYENTVSDAGPIAFRDGAVFGDGLIKVYAEHDRVTWCRVLPHELVVDELEALYGMPRSLYQERPVDKSRLTELFPGKSSAIASASPSREQSTTGQSVADLVDVYEAWHLPSGPDAKDGKHVICLDSEVLLSEAWTHDYFPFARFPWCPRLAGFWSQGGAEQIQSIQIEVNALMQSVQRACRLSGMHYWLVENGSKVAKSVISNAIGSIIPYTGPNAPQVVTPPVVPPEIYRQIEALKQAAYEQLGISQLSAASQKPAGLDSGAALREYNDIESDRFQTIGKRYESFHLELAALSIGVAKEIAEQNSGSYPVSVPSGRALQKIDWKDVALEEDDFVMQCFPISSLPNEPAGRLQTIQELVQAGMIPQSMAAKLMQFPDLEQYESLSNAMEDRLEELFDEIVDEGEYSPPEPWFDPTRARELCLQYILRGESQELADERLEMLHTWLSQLDMLEQAAVAAATAQAPQGALPAATGQTPQAQPAQPPQSDLIPFGAAA